MHQERVVTYIFFERVSVLSFEVYDTLIGEVFAVPNDVENLALIKPLLNLPWEKETREIFQGLPWVRSSLNWKKLLALGSASLIRVGTGNWSKTVSLIDLAALYIWCTTLPRFSIFALSFWERPVIGSWGKGTNQRLIELVRRLLPSAQLPPSVYQNSALTIESSVSCQFQSFRCVTRWNLNYKCTISSYDFWWERRNTLQWA